MTALESEGSRIPDVLVIIVAFDSGVHLQKCIDCLERQIFTDWTAIVWDNASSDTAVADLCFGDRVRVVMHEANIGFAAANNRAAALAKSRYIVTLNPDAFPEPEWLGVLVKTADDRSVESVASLQLIDDEPELLDGAGDCMSISGVAWRGGFQQPRSIVGSDTAGVFSACAAAALYRRDAFEAAHGFEERFFCYFEDVDLGFRLRLAGGRCVLAPAAIVRHVGSASSSQLSGFAEFHGTRNRTWTFMRNMPLAFLPVALPAHLVIVAYLLLRSPTAAQRKARLDGLTAAWKGRRTWLSERRNTPLWISLRPFSLSPWSLSHRSPHLFPEQETTRDAT